MCITLAALPPPPPPGGAGVRRGQWYDARGGAARPPFLPYSFSPLPPLRPPPEEQVYDARGDGLTNGGKGGALKGLRVVLDALKAQGLVK